MKISRTFKVAGIVFMLSFIPIAILGLLTLKDSISENILYTFLLMIGFIGIPIYFIVLLFELWTSRRKDKTNTKTSIWKYVCIVNLIVLIPGLVESNWSIYMYLKEYLILNLVVTLITLIVPFVYSRQK